MSKLTGGPAFPDPGRAQSEKQREKLTEMGMTLHDYFAAHSPIDTAIAHDTFYRQNGRNAGIQEMLTMLANLRHRYADTMLAARQAPAYEGKLVESLRTARAALEGSTSPQAQERALLAIIDALGAAGAL
ncbi:MAG: hypothetical protein V4724_26855 [Pseudomonadota bacterium]